MTASRAYRVLFLFISLFSLSAFAAPALIPAAPQVSSKGHILMDASSGEIITSNNADERLEPASLTKMMTAYVAEYEIAQGNLREEDLVKVSKNAWAQNPIFKGSSLMWLEVGMEVTVQELLKGIIISSGNDATVAIAEHIAGSVDAFVDIMNQHAKLLGMKGTHFANPHGLPHPEQYTTARDMAILAKAAIHRFPEAYKLYAEKSYEFNNIKQPNRNRLLWRDPSVDGLKTGHTESAGYCLVSSAKKDDMRLIAVVMGAATEEARFKDSQKLLSYGFRYYQTLKLYEKGKQIKEAKLWAGATETLALTVAEDIYVTVPRSQTNAVKAEMQVDKYIEAPIKKGQVLGELDIRLHDKVIAQQDIIARDSIESGGFVDVIVDKVKLFVMGLID